MLLIVKPLWRLGEVRRSLPKALSVCQCPRSSATVTRAFPGECRSVRAFGVSVLVCTAANLFDAPLHDGAPTEEHVGPAARDSGAWPVGDAEVWVKLIHTSWSLIR